MKWIRLLTDVGMNDVALVGGKNASLGEMLQALSQLGVRVPEGFAVTAEAYRYFVDSNDLDKNIRKELDGLDTHNLSDLKERSDRIRESILSAQWPDDLEQEIRQAYENLCKTDNVEHLNVAVRSSATA